MKQQNEQGVALIIVFFVMVIIVAAVLSAATFLYSTVKVIRNISNSVVAFYAADSGVEKVLYYDRKETVDTGVVVDGTEVYVRGMCAMCDAEAATCATEGLVDPSLECESCSASVPATDQQARPDGCKPATCDDCTISFITCFGGDANCVTGSQTNPSNGTTYTVTSTVFYNKDPYNMEIDASGLSNDNGRALNIIINSDDTF